METTDNNNPAATSQPQLSDKIDALFKQKTITKEDLLQLSSEEQDLVFKKIDQAMNTLKEEERDELLEQIAPILPKGANNDIWENNHYKIMRAIGTYMAQCGMMPKSTDIIKTTGLSRQTICKHLKEYKNNELYARQKEQYKMLTGNMLGMLYHLAACGDVKAIKLYLQATGVLGSYHTVNQNFVENQHNYIQINETRLSQEQIEKLSPERLKQIEELLKTPTPDAPIN